MSVTPKVGLLAFAAALYGCAHVDEQSFYVRDASLQERARHDQLATTFVSKRTHLGYEDKEFVVTGHRIGAGKGTVLAFRSFAPGSPLKVDQAGFQKITVFLPSRSISEGSEIHIPHPQGAMAFYSSGSANFPGGGGCFGYASAGSVRVLSIVNSDITIKADLQFRLSGPAGTALSDCEDKRVQATYTAREIRVQDLTPWQGAAGKNIYEETIAP